MKRLLLCLTTLFFVLALVPGTPSLAAEKLIKGNVRIVIGSKSTGGDTYQNSAIIAQALEKKLGVHVKVDAVGATAAFQTIARTGAHGNTLMIFHDQSYLGYLYGVTGYKDIFTSYIVGPTVAINPGNAYLVPKKSPYKTADDVIAACGKGTRVSVAIQPGGVSEIGFSAMKNAVKLKYPGKEGNLVAVHTGSQADKNQLLFQGQADVINGSVQANEQYTRLPANDQRAMRFIWLTARRHTIEQANPEGLGKTTRAELLKFVEPNVVVPMDKTHNFTFDKEFFFLYNKDMSPKIVAYLDKALSEIFAEGKIEKVQKKAFFIPNFLPSAKARAHLEAKMEAYKKIIEAIR